MSCILQKIHSYRVQTEMVLYNRGIKIGAHWTGGVGFKARSPIFRNRKYLDHDVVCGVSHPRESKQMLNCRW